VSDQIPEDIRAGSLLAGYRLEERIGLGGMAVVFRAHDSRLDRDVALKILAPALARDDAFRQRFIRESRAAAAVDHPHIIPVYEAGESDGVLFIAMRYVRGGDVRSLLDRSGPIPVPRAAEIISQVASALDAAHARGLVHRDVKPGNMLLESGAAAGRPDHVYLSDFGLSKGSLAVSGGLTATGQFLGTLDYVAPEQIESRPLDGRTDEYALACSAFEMLCGEPPFRRDQSVSVMYAHLSEPPPLIRTRRPDLPPDIDDVLATGMAKAPGDRYESCLAFAAALGRAIGVTSGDAAPPAHPVTQIAVPGISQADSAGAAAHEPAAREPTAREPAADVPAADVPTGEVPVADYRTEQASSPPGDGPGRHPGREAAAPERRRWWRSPAPLAGLVAAVLVLAAGGYLLASRSTGSGHSGASGAGGPALTVPACSTATAKAGNLTGISTATTPLSGDPFGAVVTGSGYAFVTTGNAVAVLRTRTGLAPALVRTIPAPGANKGITLTPDGEFALAAAGSGAVVINVAAAISDDASPVAGTLTSPTGSGAVEVTVTANGHYALVTLQDSAEMAVFNLARGFGPHAFVGYVPLAAQPVGMASYGTWVYVVSLAGTLAVLNLHTAETDPAHAVVATVRAGCGAARALVSGDGTIVWVTARDSDTLLAFSTARLRAKSAGALIARVAVGEAPLGETFADHGARILIVDSNLDGRPGVTSNIAVVSTASALRRRPALLGYLPVGLVPRQFAVEPGGRTVLVTVQKGHQLEAIDVGGLP
jgi:serine/threonine-protein kinase